MTHLFRWTVWLATALVIFSLAVTALAYYLAMQSLPEYSKKTSLPGPYAQIDIVRDTYNVPHVYAQSDHDILFGLGYAHAQDRLWQMSLMRRTAQGKLSEIFGVRTLASDRLFKRFDIYGAAQTSFDVQSNMAKNLLEAYSKGINARIFEVNREALGRGAPELFLFDAPFATWKPVDSIAILKLLAIKWSQHIEKEVQHARLALALEDEQRIADLLPIVPGKGRLSLAQTAKANPTLDGNVLFAKRPPGIESALLAPMGLKGASNAYAASPMRSAAGSALLANDPHVALSAPSLWYLARLELSSGGVIGATIPGIPLVLSGRSERLGWGITSSYIDDQDLYVEEIDPARPEYYRTKNGYKKFKKRPSIINIKNQSPITMTLRWSDNGPILTSDQFNFGQVTPKDHVIAVASTALRRDDISFTSGFELMRAGSVTQGIAALENFQAPSLNVVLSDKTGIGIKTVGLRPKRNQNHQTLGRMPSLGWQESNQWQGFLPYSDAPQSINPESGLIANTNNKLTDEDFPKHGSFDWGDSQRIKRLDRLLTGRSVHTQQSFTEAQLDTVSFTARTLLPLVGEEFWFTGQNGAPGTIERDRHTALSLLGKWDGDMNEHLPEPLIYSAWMRALQDRLIRDEIGPLADTFLHVEPLFIERVYRDIEGASKWCDIVQSSSVETCRDMAELALNDAIIMLKETFGGSIEALRWGDAHQATHLHMALGQVPLLKHVVNIYQSTSGGDHTLQRGRSKGNGKDSFQNVHAAGYRGIYDFADPDSSLFVIATGQSGHPLSRHYDDLGQLWRRGEYWTMSLDKNLVSAASVGQTVIRPIEDQIDAN